VIASAARRRAARAVLLAAGLSLTVLSALRPPEWIRGPAEAYVWAARRVARGELTVRAYDDAWVSAEVGKMTGGRVRDILSPTPPTLPVLMQPLVRAEERLLTPAWTAVNVGALAASVILLAPARSWPIAIVTWILALGAVSATTALRENLARGQVYAPMLLFASMLVRGLRDDRPRLAGLGAGLLVLTKLSGWPVWVLLGWTRSLHALTTAAIVAAAGLLVSLLVAGIQVWVEYVWRVVPRWLDTPKAAVPAYQTIGGFFERLLRYDEVWNQAPVANLPWLATALTVASATALVLLIVRRAPSIGLPAAAASAILSGVLLSPVAEQYHYLLAVPAAAVALEAWLARPTVTVTIAIAASLALLFAPLPFKEWGASSAPLSYVIAYPRVWGGLGLVTLVLWRSAHDDD
jgi:hypothetical protein